MYKRIISVLTIISLIILQLSLSSCKDSETDNDKLKIVTTIFPLYDFTEQIAGDAADVSLLLRAGQDIHSYEPSPQDIISIRNCDLFIYIGGESDEWVNGILSSLDKKPKTLALIDAVPLLHEAEIGGEHEHVHDGEDEEDEEYDEHIWTSPKRALYMVDAIKSSIIECDKQNEKLYHSNAEDYSNKLRELDSVIENTVKNGKRKLLVFGDRFPFLYFTHDYNLRAEAALSGCAENSEPSSKRITELAEIVTENSIPVVLFAEMSNGNLADTICSETGAVKYVFHSCHNLTNDEWSAGDDYISIMYKNAEVLKKALS